MCWPETYTYDGWGNLLSLGPNSTTQPNYVGCTQESGFNYTSAGQITTKNQIAAYCYDAAGDLVLETTCPTGSFTPAFQYDAENHLISTAGVNYTYDGDGKRVMKSSGTIYWYGTSSDAYMETDLSNNLKFMYFFFNGQRVARQNNSNQVTWYFTDHLGTSRVVWSVNGIDTSDYYPFGGERVITSGAGNQYKFTGKERDAESGLDNFGARYNSSTMARWMSPDVLNLTDARVQNPTNMLNKYLYGANNPLKYIDPDGQDAVALYEPPNGVSAGHFMLFVYNQDTGASAMMSYGPVDSSPAGLAMTATGGPVPATQTFGWPQTADQLRDNAAALSIRTTPEEAQEIINAIKSFSPSSTDYKLYSRNCSTVCRDLLKEVGLLPQNSRSITPAGLWDNIFARYARYNPFYDWLLKNGFTPHGKGNDYGNPRFGMNTFDFVMQSLSRPCVTILVPDGMGGSKPMTTCD